MQDPFIPSPELAAIAKRRLISYSTRQSAAAANLFSASDPVHVPLTGLGAEHLIHRMAW